MLKIVLTILMVSIALAGVKPSKEIVRQINSYKITYKEVRRVANNLEYLDSDQITILRKVYQKCKPYGLSNTCMAISYKESRLGVFLINEDSGDYGIMGINLNTFIRAKNLKVGYWGKKRWVSKLTVNNDINIKAAVDNLLYWKKIYHNNWRLIWGSYNGGWRPNVKYSKDILLIIKGMKLYFRKHRDIERYIKDIHPVKIEDVL